MLEIELDNKGSIEYKEVEIKAPSEDNTMRIGEAL
jgi:hypothetical protein